MDKTQKTENKKQETNKEVEEFKNKYLRALADYQNFEKRVDKEKEEIRNNAGKYLILKLLPILDQLEKAEVFIKDKNLQLVKDNFLKVLKEEGLEEIQVKDREFDPYTAEVIDMAAGDKDNMVVEVLRKGYKLNGKIIRVAQVKVSRKK